ncbi:hypothetical protein [Arachnia propionica]|uniref:Uncharacterized protein n=1 Tax=Arachnia propionica TaxID=1750 RepID=A0A3P1WVX0_9ACTN|nr:hypothetical protein [Arachnia propionica]RRD48523.1 hypothetical protein EII35_12370 [Arachnia propionica]
MSRGWFGGRLPWLAVLAWLLSFVVVHTHWWLPLDGPWSQQFGERLAAIGELAPALLGAMALYAMTPRLDWIDAQSSRPVRLIDAAGMAATIVAFAALPLLARALFEVSDLYTAFVPEGWTLADPALLAEAAPWSLFVLFSCTILVVLGTTLVGMALVGPLVGAASVVLWLFLLFFLQARGMLDLIHPGRVGMGLGWPDGLLVAAALAAGSAAYWASRSSRRPLAVVAIERFSRG